MSARRSERYGAEVGGTLLRSLHVRFKPVLVACGLLLVLAARVAAQPCPPLPGNAYAFLPVDVTCPADPIVHFADAQVQFDCSFLAETDHAIACGEPTLSACVASCRNTTAIWNADLVGRFSFIERSNVGYCNSDDGFTSIGGGTTVCDGSQFGPSVLAVTLRLTIISGPRKGEQLDADIAFNQAFNPFFANDPRLFRATLGHELGHVLGLEHPDMCGLDDNVLMHSTIGSPADPCFVEVATADDVAGAARIYPLVGPTPTPPLCGDADGNGVVDVIDAANVLRAAVTLPSACATAPAVCDMNGSGGIDVIDAANALRRAVGLAAANSCFS